MITRGEWGIENGSFGFAQDKKLGMESGELKREN
jgi:hypothetical protein